MINPFLKSTVSEVNEEPVVMKRELLSRMGGGAFALAFAGMAVSSLRIAKADDRDDDHLGKASKAQSPLVGSWLLQVKIKSGPQAGEVETTLTCFAPGGLVLDSDNFSPNTDMGHWVPLGQNHYSYILVNLKYDTVTKNVVQILVPEAEIVFDSENTFHSIATKATLYIYDPKKGALQQKIDVSNVSDVTAIRITPNWSAPSRFPYV